METTEGTETTNAAGAAEASGAAEAGGAATPGPRAPRPDITSLHETGTSLLADAAKAHSGRAARTVLTLPGLRATLIALTAGNGLSEHEAPGAATLMCVSGRVTLHAGDRVWPLTTGDLVPIPDARHGLTAEEDSTVLLTVRLD